MSKILLTLGVAVGLMLASACDLTGPADLYQLPEPDTSLDPDRLTVGEYIATPCAFAKSGNRLAHLREREERALVDVFFGRDSADGPRDGPTASDIDLVRSHGGRVLYRFNVPAVRARITLSRIPDLVEQGFWITVRDVPDASRYDVELTVGFRRGLQDADIDLFESLGGRVTYRWDSIDGLAGILPDRSIAVLQDRSDVEYVQASSVGCIA